MREIPSNDRNLCHLFQLASGPVSHCHILQYGIGRGMKVKGEKYEIEGERNGESNADIFLFPRQLKRIFPTLGVRNVKNVLMSNLCRILFSLNISNRIQPMYICGWRDCLPCARVLVEMTNNSISHRLAYLNGSRCTSARLLTSKWPHL